MDQGLVAIAKIVKPRGLRGEMVAEILTDFPERFDRTEDVILLTSEGVEKRLKIANSWFQKDRVILKFEGIDSIEAADRFRNSEVCIAESDVVPLEEGEFFDWQLEGCAVVTVEGETIGSVKELMRTGGTEILIIEGGDREYMIPFAESICTEVDVESKLIRIDPPEGLLDF